MDPTVPNQQQPSAIQDNQNTGNSGGISADILSQLQQLQQYVSNQQQVNNNALTTKNVQPNLAPVGSGNQAQNHGPQQNNQFTGSQAEQSLQNFDNTSINPYSLAQQTNLQTQQQQQQASIPSAVSLQQQNMGVQNLIKNPEALGKNENGPQQQLQQQQQQQASQIQAQNNVAQKIDTNTGAPSGSANANNVVNPQSQLISGAYTNVTQQQQIIDKQSSSGVIGVTNNTNVSNSIPNNNTNQNQIPLQSINVQQQQQNQLLLQLQQQQLAANLNPQSLLQAQAAQATQAANPSGNSISALTQNQSNDLQSQLLQIIASQQLPMTQTNPLLSLNPLLNQQAVQNPALLQGLQNVNPMMPMSGGGGGGSLASFHQPAQKNEIKLFVGGLAFATVETDIVMYFNKFGKVEDAIVMRNKQTGRGRGFAFVRLSFKDEQEAQVQKQVILNLNLPGEGGHLINNKRVDVKSADDYQGKSDQDSQFNNQQMRQNAHSSSVNGQIIQKPNPYVTVEQKIVNNESNNQATEQISFSYPKSKIFVGGLDFKLEVDELKHHFSQFGEVVDAIILKDIYTGQSRGFGFVTFKDEQVATNLVRKVTVTSINGRKVDIKKAEPKSSGGNDQQAPNPRRSTQYGGPQPNNSGQSDQPDRPAIIPPYGQSGGYQDNKPERSSSYSPKNRDYYDGRRDGGDRGDSRRHQGFNREGKDRQHGNSSSSYDSGDYNDRRPRQHHNDHIAQLKQHHYGIGGNSHKQDGAQAASRNQRKDHGRSDRRRSRS